MGEVYKRRGGEEINETGEKAGAEGENRNEERREDGDAEEKRRKK